MTACDEIRTDLGAFTLGALEPDEAHRVEAHLDGCEACRAELEQLSFASALLRTPVARAFAAEPEPDAALVEHALANVASTRAVQKRKTRRLGLTAAASSAGLVAAVVVAVSLGTRAGDSFAPSGQSTALRPAAGIAAVASVRLSPRPWGTQVDLRTEQMPALPRGAYYEVWLVRADGTRVAAGTFRPTAAEGKARVRLAAGISRSLVARIGVTLEGVGPGKRVLDATA